MPVIDISCWINCELPTSLEAVSAEQHRVAQQWDESFSQHGLAVVVGHNVPESTFHQLQDDSKAFFSQTVEKKMEYHHGAYGNSQGGYTPAGLETVALSASESDEKEVKQPDPVESFVFNQRSAYFQTSQYHDKKFFATAQQYFCQHMLRVLKTLHYLSACGLKQDPLDYFDRFYDESLAGNKDMGFNGNALRIAQYMSTSSLHSNEPALSRYGAHTDYQGYTILRPDSRDWTVTKHEWNGQSYDIQFGGLEIQLKDTSSWVPVQMPTAINALVINAGDFLQRWTNDRWLSVTHRVSSPRILNAAVHEAAVVDVSSVDLSRTAIVFFSGPVENCLIESIENDDPSTFKYDAIRSGEHLRIKLGRTNNST